MMALLFTVECCQQRIRTDQLPFAGVMVFRRRFYQVSLGGHVQMIRGQSVRLVVELADLPVERKPRDVDGAE